MQLLAKFYRYPYPDGARKVKSRAWREWIHTQKGSGLAWPGAEICNVADEETARKLARIGLRSLPRQILTCEYPKYSHVSNQILTCEDPVAISSYLSSILQEKGDKGVKYACLDLQHSLPLCQDPAFRLWTILAAHARVYRQPQQKVTSRIWEQAGIQAHATKTRVLSRLEESGMAKVFRGRGQAPVVTLRLSCDGFPAPFEESKRT